MARVYDCTSQPCQPYACLSKDDGHILRNLAITQVLPVRFLAPFHRVDQTAAAVFCCSRKEKLHDRERQPRFASKLGMAEAGVEIVDDDVGFAALPGTSGELTARVDLKKLGDLISKFGQRNCSVES